MSGSGLRPRLSVFRSNKFVYAQLIDDEKGITLVAVHEKELKVATGLKKAEKAKELGKLLAEKAIAKKIKQVVLDRSSYKYHGRVKAIADGAREGGIIL